MTTTETRKTSGQKQANAEIERLNEELNSRSENEPTS